MDRIYNTLIIQHFNECQQMMFLPGPRQSGKTTIAQMAAKLGKTYSYINWDKDSDQQLILAGIDAVAIHCNLNQLTTNKPFIVFDEIHKYNDWRNFLKGFYDSFKEQCCIIVTGSSKLDIYRKNADSLLGRYFIYRVFPLSAAEIIHTDIPLHEIRQPSAIKAEDFANLIDFGGFPEPYLKHSTSFSNKWNKTRLRLLFKEDIRELTNLQEISQVELLAQILKSNASEQVNMSTLAKHIKTTVRTIEKWITTLEQFYYCFRLRPWTKNITRSLLKEPKLYLYNWADIKDKGARAENIIALHLFKAVAFWTDSGLGNYSLHFIRDKEKREVDFLVVKDDEPWFLVEVKNSNSRHISKNLQHFHAVLNTKHAFQVCMEMDYVDNDCFSHTQPIIVPAATFLSQLI